MGDLPSEFRFMVICQSASRREADGLISLFGVVDDIATIASERTELAAVVGAVLRPEVQGKRLDLMAWKFGRTGERTPLPGHAGTPLVLPRGLGPTVLPYQISLPIPATGIYGFELFDREGAFGPTEALLATYMFSARVAD